MPTRRKSRRGGRGRSGMKKIPITRPVFDESDRKALVGPLETGWVVQGPNVAAFEKRFGEFCGARFAAATTSCTTALHLALVALDIGPKDAVLVPSFTYVASANSVEYTGAKPILCDIDLDTFNMDVKQAAKALKENKKIRAIMPVHLFGLSADMDPLLDLAARHKLRVVEDAACALGTKYHGRHIGAFGDAGCFSFHPRKAITTGEGGMITTDNEELAKRVRSLRDHGATTSDLERHQKEGGSLLPEFNVMGFNYRMTDFQGALGVSQMAKAQKILDGRKSVAGRYDKLLADIPWLITPKVPKGYGHSYQSYVCRINERRFKNDIGAANRFRNRLMKDLETNGISVRQGTHAVHTLGFYRKKYGLKDGNFPNAFAADRLSITLPLYAGMTDDEQGFVVEKLRSIAQQVTKEPAPAR